MFLVSITIRARILNRFAPSGFALTFSAALLPRASGFALATYPMTLPGSQGVSMPSFITIFHNMTSPASHFVPLQASPAGLLGRFVPLALCARILGRFAPSKIFQKKMCLNPLKMA